MKIYKISNKIGTSFYVSINNLWSHRKYLEEVYKNISEGRFSLSKGKTPIATKSLQIKGSFFIMDGHHRVLEAIIDGEKQIQIEWNKHLPYLDAGIGNDLPQEYMRIIDFISEKNKKVK